MAYYKFYFNSLFSRRRRISAVTEHILLCAGRVFVCCNQFEFTIKVKLLNRRRRIRNFRDKPKRLVTATTTLSATRALHIKTPRDRQRALQEMLMSNWKEDLWFSACHLWRAYLPRVYIQLPVGQWYSWAALGGSLSYLRSAITQRVRSWNFPRRSWFIITNSWCSVSCSPNAATDVIRKRTLLLLLLMMMMMMTMMPPPLIWSGHFAEFRQLPFFKVALIKVSSSLMHVTHRDEINRFNRALACIFLLHRIRYRQHYRSQDSSYKATSFRLLAAVLCRPQKPPERRPVNCNI